MNKLELTPAGLAGAIDHTLLRAEAGGAAITQLCEEAVQYGFAAVCVHGCFVRRAADLLAEHPSRVCSVVGFPMGACHTRVKVAEAAQAVQDGADELDMVINLAAALDDDMTYLAHDIEAVLKVCREGEAVGLKLILETAALPREVKIRVCRLGANLGVDYLKTSTGLHPRGGATLEDVRLLVENRGSCRVKAAGGIRDLATARAYLEAGAERLGTSAGVKIMEELKKEIGQ